MMMVNPKVLSVALAGLMALSAGTASLAADSGAKKAETKPAAASAEAMDQGTVATINGRAITKKLLDKVMEQAAASGQQDTNATRKEVLKKLVDLELISQDAEAKGLDKDAEFVLGMEMLRKQQLYAALLTKEILDKVKVTPEEVSKYYDEHKDSYKSEEEVKASHILVATEEEAKKAKERIDKGEDFAAVAKAVSTCPSASRGGDLGFFGKGRMVPEFEKAAYALKEGEVSGPVKTQFGWHIIKMTGRKEAKTKTLDETKAEIEQKLLQEKQQKAYEGLLASLKSAAKISTSDDLGAPAPKAKPETEPAAKPAAAAAPADKDASDKK